MLWFVQIIAEESFVMPHKDLATPADNATEEEDATKKAEKDETESFSRVSDFENKICQTLLNIEEII